MVGGAKEKSNLQLVHITETTSNNTFDQFIGQFYLKSCK
jgi:hypothetical protein